MVTIALGTKAPSISLPTSNGAHKRLSEELRDNPMVIVSFFKVSCPVCQTAFPFLERLHVNYPSIPIWGVSQDDLYTTESFAQKYKISFTLVFDETLASSVEYDLVSVPSTFAINSDGTIAQAIYGFGKKDFEELNAKLAAACNTEAKVLFTEDDDVPTMKPG